jgi:hypothetical protein
MTPADLDLARRAVACKGWKWLPGMRAVGQYPGYPVRVHAFGENVRDTDDMEEPEPWGWQQPAPYGDHVYPGPYLPDLTDPATLGCLLALVREAWGSNQCFVRCDPSWFVLCRTPPAQAAKIGHGWSGPFTGATEAEALVAALEAAP